MTPWRRSFGTDLVETLLWGAGGFLVTIMAGEYFHDRMMAMATAVTLILAYGVRRNVALKALSPEGETSGSWRMADVDARLAELEAMQTRVAELEERVDFAERLLARQAEAPKIEAPR